MGKILSQGEIDNLLSGLLKDSTVLPATEKPAETEHIPAGIAAFKAKMAAAAAEAEAKKAAAD